MQNLSSVVEINKYVYTRGCVEAISELVDRNMNLVAIVCLGSALAQVIFFLVFFGTDFQIFFSWFSNSYLQCFLHDHYKDRFLHNVHVGCNGCYTCVE